MSKEYLEAFKIVYNNFDYLISDVVIENDDVNICLKTIKEQLPTIKQALQRLEANDKVNDNENDKVKKTYLKWEDLKFTEENQTMEVLLNGVTYNICFYEFTIVGQNEVNIYTNGTHIVTLNSYYQEDIKFFNDLKLEMVKE